MFDPERLLTNMVGGALKKKKKKKKKGSMLGGGGKAMLGMGALALAFAAYEHFTDQKKQQGQQITGGQQPQLPPQAGQTPPAPQPYAPRQAATPPPPPPFSVHQSSQQVPPPIPPPGSAQPQAGQTPPVPGPPPLPQQSAHSDEAMLLLRAMIAAANADHEIDHEERNNILQHVEESGFGDEDRAALEFEFDHPRSIAALAAEVHSPDMARQVYAAALLAIDVDTDAERVWLRKLAERLELGQEIVSQLHEELE